MQSIKRNYIYNLGYQILSILLPLVTTPYVSRVLGSEKIGLFSYLYSIETYFLVFAALGTAFYGKREVARLRDDKEALSRAFWEIEILSIITTSVVLLAWLIFSAFQHTFQDLYFILALNILAITFDVSWLYAGIERFDKIVYKNLAIKALSLTCLFLFVRDSSDLNIYILINSAGTLLGNISLWIKLKQYVDRPSIKLSNLAIHLKSTIIYFLPTIATTIYTVLDKTMLQAITSDFNQNGFYEQAVKLCRIPLTVLLSMDTVMGSRMSYLVEKKREEEIQNRLGMSIQLVFFLGIPMVAGLDLIVKQLIPWFFGEGFDSVANLVYAYSPLILCIGINNCLSEQYLTPVGKRKLTAIIVSISAVLNFVLNYLLIPKYQAVGASIASVFSEAFIAIAYMVMSNRIICFKDYCRFSYRNILSAIIMYLVIHLVTFNMRSSIILTMGQIVLGAVLYFGILLAIKDKFTKEVLKIVFRRKRSIET